MESAEITFFDTAICCVGGADISRDRWIDSSDNRAGSDGSLRIYSDPRT